MIKWNKLNNCVYQRSIFLTNSYTVTIMALDGITVKSRIFKPLNNPPTPFSRIILTRPSLSSGNNLLHSSVDVIFVNVVKYDVKLAYASLIELRHKVLWEIFSISTTPILTLYALLDENIWELMRLLLDCIGFLLVLNSDGRQLWGPLEYLSFLFISLIIVLKLLM